MINLPKVQASRAYKHTYAIERGRPAMEAGLDTHEQNKHPSQEGSQKSFSKILKEQMQKESR